MKFRLSILILTSLISFSSLQAQQQEKSVATYTNYLLYVPQDKPSNGLYPLMLFLHGSGERGTDLNLVKKNGPPSFLDKKNDFPFVVVSPQCPNNRGWDTQSLLSLLDHIESTLPIDKNKVYVTGLSMGGFGAWELAQAAPERFAAIAPICGGGNLDRICLMRDVPVWAFHGAKDPVVPYKESERLVKRLQELKADVKFTLYPDAEHDSWSATYQNPELYKWLLSKSKNQDSPALNKDTSLSYVGRYKYSKKENMEVTYDGKNLYVESSIAKQKVIMQPVTQTKFKLSGPFSGFGVMNFNITQKGKITGFTFGQCENKYCARIKK